MLDLLVCSISTLDENIIYCLCFAGKKTMIGNTPLLFVTFLLSMGSIAADQCKTTSAVPGHSLIKHVIKKVPAKDYERCTFACEQQSGCYSVNFISVDKTCELNNATRYWAPWSFITKESSLYSGILHGKQSTTQYTILLP